MTGKSQSNLRFNFSDNRLTVNRNKESLYEITVWPKPHAKARNPAGCWYRIFPQFRLVDYPYKPPHQKKTSQLQLGLDIDERQHLTKAMAYDLLRKSMPFSYAIALAPFRSHQWNLITLLSMKRRFYDLLKSSPVLAYMLANSDPIMKRISRKEIMMDKLTGMKQAELLDLLGLPGTKSFTQILRKIKPASAHPELTAMLWNCAKNDSVIKKLGHMKSINLGALTLFTHNDEIRNALTPQLLDEVGGKRAENHYPRTARELEDGLEWHWTLRPDHRPPRFQTTADVSAWHEEIVAEGTRFLADQTAARDREQIKQLRKKMAVRLPDPPIPGTDTIQPLRTGKELLIEGQQQRNCVGGYIPRVQRKECYIYRVLAPKRATLSLTKWPDGEWRIGELKAACNKPVKKETRAAVEHWLSQSRIGI